MRWIAVGLTSLVLNFTMSCCICLTIIAIFLEGCLSTVIVRAVSQIEFTTRCPTHTAQLTQLHISFKHIHFVSSLIVLN